MWINFIIYHIIYMSKKIIFTDYIVKYFKVNID